MSSFITSIKPLNPIAFTDKKSGNTGEVENAIPFANVLSNAVNEYETSQQTADQESNELALGNSDNLAQFQIDSLKAQTALQTTVQITSKMVTAYKDIMQMQV